jgi:hypothetical protein
MVARFRNHGCQSPSLLLCSANMIFWNKQLIWGLVNHIENDHGLSNCERGLDTLHIGAWMTFAFDSTLQRSPITDDVWCSIMLDNPWHGREVAYPWWRVVRNTKLLVKVNTCNECCSYFRIKNCHYLCWKIWHNRAQRCRLTT